MELNRREVATILGSLRTFQDAVLTMEPNVGRDITDTTDRQRHAARYLRLRHFERVTPLSAEEIDRLCDRIRKEAAAR